PAGVTGVLFVVPSTNDNLAEPSESFTLTATVTSGNTANTGDSGTGTILDNDPCILNVTGVVTNVSCPTGSDGAINITVTGAVGTPTYLWSDGATTEDRTNLAPGNYSVTVTDNGLSNCTATASFTVGTTPDLTPPVIVCPVDINTTSEASCTDAPVTITPATATDNCGTPAVTGVRSDGKLLTEPFPIGTTTIVWTATDGSGNTSTCTQTIRVVQGVLLTNYTFSGATAYPFSANYTAAGVTSSVTSTEPFSVQNPGSLTGTLAFKTNLVQNPALAMENGVGAGTSKYFQFSLSGVSSYRDFKLYLQGSRLPDGATQLSFAYSTDGTNFTSNGTLNLPVHNTYYQGVIDWTGITALNNPANLYVRIYPVGGDPNSSSTRLMIDNFQVLGGGTCTPCFNVKALLEGALLNNGGGVLMRDNLRVSPFTGANYIPVTDPYGTATYSTRFTRVLDGLNPALQTITNPTAMFANKPNPADDIVDWVFIELRDKNNNKTVVSTRSVLVQRDGDFIDVDGSSCIRFPGTPADDYYVVVRHRNHLGVMSASPISKATLTGGGLVDFTNGSTAEWNFGTTHPVAGPAGFDFTGLSQKTVNGKRALWLGNTRHDRQVKYRAPNDDPFQVLRDVLLYPSNTTRQYNYDFAFGYFAGDVDMNSKAKYQAPNDDVFLIFRQVLLYPLNTTRQYNFDFVLEQIPY
ncbi:MAG TPA: HYR domain-containing protein, partial [Chitinophagaceae bacterium]|nr:HYR domain-containing protein [Chitinophagaceae bacterium]